MLKRCLYSLVSGWAVVLLFGCAVQANALTLSPIKYESVVDQGGEQVYKLYITNDSKSTKTYALSVATVTADDYGHVQFVSSSYDPAAHWISFSTTTLAVRKKAQTTISFTAQVPSDAPSGVHYLAIVVEEKPPTGQIGVGIKAASLLALHVAGVAHEALQVQQKEIEYITATSTGLRFTLHNAGNVEVFATARLEVQPASKSSRERILAVGNEILAGTNRTLKVEVPFEHLSAWWPTKEKFMLNITYGMTEQHILVSVTKLYVPRNAQIIFSVVLLLAVVGAILSKIYVFEKK